MEIAETHREIGDVRGLGAMIAIELFENGDPGKPNAALTADIVARAREKGLILALLRSLLQHLAHPRSTHY